MNLEVIERSLIEETRYSVSIFIKKHIKELLQKNKVYQFRETIKEKKGVKLIASIGKN